MRRTRMSCAAGLTAALAIALPAGTATAQTPAVSSLAGFPATAALPPAAAAAAAWALEGGLATLPAPVVPPGGRLVFGGILIGDVVNGGTTGIIANGGPVDSGNVIDSP